MPPGARQHFLPACFIARFSEDPNPDLRRRLLYVARRGGREPFPLVAERAAFVRNLYSEAVDSIWTAYEARLPAALDALRGGDELDGDTWLRVLVPFAAALLLRGPDFEDRFQQRLATVAPGLNRRAGTDARPFELQRLLAPVTAARWVVMHAMAESPVISSDMGWAPYRDALQGELGFAIPIDLHTVLGLVPARTRGVLRWNGTAWFAAVEHRYLEPGNHEGLNQTVASWAYRQVFGPTRESMPALQQILNSQEPIAAEPFPFGPLGGVNGPPNELTWHRLVAASKKLPTDPSLAKFAFEPSALTDGWAPVLVLPLNLPEFPPALRLRGDIIEVALHTVLKAEADVWTLAQDVPLSYPLAPRQSAHAELQSRIQSRGDVPASASQRRIQVEVAPGVIRDAVRRRTVPGSKR